MAIYLDSADLTEIEKFVDFPFIFGVTTNPTLISKALGKKEITRKDLEEHIKKIADLCDGEIFVQTTASKADKMVEEAKGIHKILGDRGIVKIPLTGEGLKAIDILSDEKIRTAATAVFTPVQAYLAMLSGADFVIPYYSRLQKRAQDGLDIVEDILDIIENQELEGQLLVASVKNAFDVLEIVRAGADCVTLPGDLISELMLHQQTDEAVKDFDKSLKITG